MKKTATLALAALITTLVVSTGTAAPAAPAAKPSTEVATDQTSLQERKGKRTLAKRNAAAKALKAGLEKKDPAKKSTAQ